MSRRVLSIKTTEKFLRGAKVFVYFFPTPALLGIGPRKSTNYYYEIRITNILHVDLLYITLCYTARIISTASYITICYTVFTVEIFARKPENKTPSDDCRSSEAAAADKDLRRGRPLQHRVTAGSSASVKTERNVY